MSDLEELGTDFFPAIKTFESSHEPRLHKLFHRVVKASERNMWYDPDTDTMVSHSEFEWMKKKGLFNQYSGNSKHPIFGDVTNYVSHIGPVILDYAKELRTLGVMIITILDAGSDTLPIFAKALNGLNSDLIHNLRYSHPNMRDYYDSLDLWIDLIHLEQARQGLDISTPLSDSLERIYMGLRRKKHPMVIKEHISKKINGEGAAIAIAQLYDLVDGDEVVLLLSEEGEPELENEEMYRFRITLTKDGVTLSRPGDE